MTAVKIKAGHNEKEIKDAIGQIKKSSVGCWKLKIDLWENVKEKERRHK